MGKVSKEEVVLQKNPVLLWYEQSNYETTVDVLLD